MRANLVCFEAMGPRGEGSKADEVGHSASDVTCFEILKNVPGCVFGFDFESWNGLARDFLSGSHC